MLHITKVFFLLTEENENEVDGQKLIWFKMKTLFCYCHNLTMTFFYIQNITKIIYSFMLRSFSLVFHFSLHTCVANSERHWFYKHLYLKYQHTLLGPLSLSPTKLYINCIIVVTLSENTVLWKLVFLVIEN